MDESSLKELSNHYNKMSDNLFSQSGLSASIKYYLVFLENRLKFSCHLGWLFLSYYPGYRSADFGFGLHYFISDIMFISINRRLFYTFQGHDASSNVTPLMIQISFNYNIGR